MSEELTGIIVATVIDGAFWLLFRSLSHSSHAELSRLEQCQVVPEGQPVASLVPAAAGLVKELPNLVAFSGTLTPQSAEDVTSRDGLRCIAFSEKHVQESRDGTVRRLLYSESRVPRMVAVRMINATNSSWNFLAPSTATSETIHLREAQSANGFSNLFQRRRDHRVPLADSLSGDYFHITESIIPAGLTLNFMGALSYDPLSRQLNLRLLEVGFTDMAELIDSVKSSFSVYRFLSRACLVTTLGLLALAVRRGILIYIERKSQTPPPPPPPSFTGDAPQAQQPQQPPPYNLSTPFHVYSGPVQQQQPTQPPPPYGHGNP